MISHHTKFVIRTQGNRARLEGEVPLGLEQDLRARFSWTNPMDLSDVVYYYHDGVMYSGIADEIASYATSRGFPCTVEHPDLPTTRFDWKMKRGYRPLQEEAVEACAEARYGKLQAPPGTGKTNMAAALVCKIGLPDTWVIVPNERPYTQALETLREHTTIHDIGELSGKKKRLGAVTVSTIQTLTRQLEKNPDGEIARAWARAQVVVVDEAHHAGSDSHINAFELLRDVRYLIGMSATPWRDDERGDWLDALLGRVIYKISRADAVTHGLSAPLTVFVDDVPAEEFGYVGKGKKVDASLFRRRGQNPFNKVYAAYVIRNELRNRMALNFAHQANTNGLSVALIVSKVEHIMELQRLCPQVVALHANTTNRAEVFDDLQSKRTMLVATTLMDEAVDVPSLSCVAMLAGGKSTIKLEQRIRCDRVFEGKDRGYVWFPRDKADFLTSHATANVKLLKAICDEHQDHELILNGQVIPRFRPVPTRGSR